MYKNRCDDWSWVADTRATSLSEVEVVINGRKLPEWSLYEVMDSLCVVMWHYLEQEWALFRKRQTLLLLRKLESFNVCNWLLKRFYQSGKSLPRVHQLFVGEMASSAARQTDWSSWSANQPRMSDRIWTERAGWWWTGAIPPSYSVMACGT